MGFAGILRRFCERERQTFRVGEANRKRGRESSSAKNRVEGRAEDELSLLTDSSLVLVSYTNIRMHLSLLSFPRREILLSEKKNKKKKR